MYRLCLSLLFVWTLGCVQAPPHVQHARANAKAHTYDVPLEEVWPFALQLLGERGYIVEKNESHGDGARFSAETGWARAGSAQLRIIVLGKSFADNSCQVSFTRQERYVGQAGASMNRDLDLEWELVRLVDPEAAAAIQETGPKPEE